MRKILTLMFLFCAMSIMAQKERRVTGEFTYYAQEGQTLGQVKMLALQFAQVNAIAQEFGTAVGNYSMLVMNNKTESFSQFSDNEVKGVWLRDTSEPKYEMISRDDSFAVKCTVKGVAREQLSSTIDFKAHVLCNGFEPNHERTDFKDGDDLYLSFQSPVDGYLAVYLMDTNQTVFCALPYYNQPDGIYSINANQEYRLFSEKEAKGTRDEAFAEGYVLTAENDLDVNLLYVIFSPNKFYKAVDELGEDDQPRNLTFDEFNKWLGKCYNRDKELSVSKYVINIRK